MTDFLATPLEVRREEIRQQLAECHDPTRHKLLMAEFQKTMSAIVDSQQPIDPTVEIEARRANGEVATADLLEQSCVVDEPSRVWSFGEIPAAREAMLAHAQAPDFELLDRQGKVVRMADYKGKKALVITWSSW